MRSDGRVKPYCEQLKPVPACAGGGAWCSNAPNKSEWSRLMIIYAICLVLGLMFTLISAFLGHFFGGS